MINQRYITLEELMKQVHPEFFTNLTMSLGVVIGMVKGGKRITTSVSSAEALKLFGDIEKVCNECGLELSAITASEIVKHLKESDVISDSKLEQFSELAEELHGRVYDEMAGFMYFGIERSKQPLLVEKNLFNSATVGVTSAFPSATIDIEEAGKCRAFERWTASVFHLMRVMELGLRVLGDTLELSPTTNRTWETILRKCDDELKKPLDQRSPIWKNDDQFFAGAAAMLRSVKDAWRNPTMHVEKVYTEEQAEDIWNAVKGFMRQLSKKLQEGPK